MSSRTLLASSLVFCAAVGFLTPQVRAADEPAATAPSPVYTGMIPDDAYAGVVLFPKRVMASPALAKFDLKSLTADLADRMGGTPTEIEQFAIFIGPFDGREPKGEVIVRFADGFGGRKWVDKYFSPFTVEEAEVAGHKFFRRGKLPNSTFQIPPGSGPVISLLDEHTYLMASESWLPKIFGAQGAKSDLISAMAGIDPAADATLVFVNTDAAKEVVGKMVPVKSLVGPLKPVGELPDLLHAAKFSIRTNPDISLKLKLLGNDEASADKIAQTIKALQQMGQAFLPALQVPPGRAMPAEQRESSEWMAGMAGKLVNGLVPQQAGKQVTVEIGGLGTLDALADRLMPAVMAARGASRRAQGMNNLKQLALAMLNCETKDGHFPANAIYSKDGKPLLSWRVYVLPFLDQTELFNKFHLDEPWDSANNKPLIEMMPSTYKNPGGNPLAVGQTRYVVPVGKDTIFDGGKGIGMAKITDGSSNTILILEVGADKAVTWTKPDDMEFNSQKPLASLGTIDGATFSAVFADGAVHALKKDIDAETFRRMILRNDGQLIDWGKF